MESAEEKTRARVLVIDDEHHFARRLAMAFQEAGFEARALSDGAEGCAALESDRPDLVVLDVRMPGVDGITCLRRLHAVHGENAPPVLLLTGDISARVDAVALVYPGSSVLTKPVSHEEVIAAARRALCTAPL